MAFFRPLTADKKVDLNQVAPAAERTLADLLPSTPVAPAEQSAAAHTLTPRAQLAGGVAMVLLATAVLFYAVGSRPAVEQHAPLIAPSAAPAAPSAPAPTSAPIVPAAASVATLTRAVVAYAAPEGAVIGPIEAGRPYTPTARLGLEWTQIAAAGSGKVWIAARELEPDPTLADLTPPTPLPQPTSPPAPVVVYKEAPPAPTQCATIAGGGISVQRCGATSIDALSADAQAEWNARFGVATAKAGQ